MLSTMKDEKNRLRTFRKWPCWNCQDPRKLAEIGFYYKGQSDAVTCVFCCGVLKQWKASDIPVVEHQVHFPQCDFIRGADVGNIPVSLKDTWEVLEEFWESCIEEERRLKISKDQVVISNYSTVYKTLWSLCDRIHIQELPGSSSVGTGTKQPRERPEQYVPAVITNAVSRQLGEPFSQITYNNMKERSTSLTNTQKDLHLDTSANGLALNILSESTGHILEVNRGSRKWSSLSRPVTYKSSQHFTSSSNHRGEDSRSCRSRSNVLPIHTHSNSSEDFAGEETRTTASENPLVCSPGKSQQHSPANLTSCYTCEAKTCNITSPSEASPTKYNHAANFQPSPSQHINRESSSPSTTHSFEEKTLPPAEPFPTQTYCTASNTSSNGPPHQLKLKTECQEVPGSKEYPKNPVDYTRESNRLASFRNWTSVSGPLPEDIARAGFYHTPTKVRPDRVKCGYCGGKLYGWQDGDGPLTEHARFFPLCPYVRLCVAGAGSTEATS